MRRYRLGPIAATAYLTVVLALAAGDGKLLWRPVTQEEIGFGGIPPWPALLLALAGAVQA